MEIALAILALALGLVLGWLAHHRLAVDYKARWLQAVGMLNDRALDIGDTADVDAPQPTPARGAPPRPVVPLRPASDPLRRPAKRPTKPAADAKPYIHGRWALWEHDVADGGVTFFAIRAGFDDVPLGQVKSKRYAGLYRMTRSNAEESVEQMNTVRPVG